MHWFTEVNPQDGHGVGGREGAGASTVVKGTNFQTNDKQITLCVSVCMLEAGTKADRRENPTFSSRWDSVSLVF